MNDEEILDRFRHLNVNKRGDRRAPHKPLLLLIAIAQLQRNEREVPFIEIEGPLRNLLKLYAPPAKRQQPELPYWHLRSDKLWQLDNARALDRQAGGFPRIAALRRTVGHLPDAVASALSGNPSLLRAAVEILLEDHFPESIHEELLDAVGISLPPASEIKRPVPSYAARKRDPSFRDKVLRAYQHRCAVTGFQAALAGTYFGCEAAHVQWHAYSGPDSVSNGIALEPTFHKLFDAGAWSLTDNGLVIVSAELTGNDATAERVRSHHRKPLLRPLNAEDELDVHFIRWHREPKLGGVFRQPPLP